MNENGSFQEKSSLVLKGEKKGSGFGFAVAAVGDVNQDGFQGSTPVMNMQLFENAILKMYAVIKYDHIMYKHNICHMSMLKSTLWSFSK